MCIERFVAECPFRSTIEYERIIWKVSKQKAERDDYVVIEAADGTQKEIEYTTVVVSHFLSHIDYMRLHRAGQPIPPCHVALSIYEGEE